MNEFERKYSENDAYLALYNKLIGSSDCKIIEFIEQFDDDFWFWVNENLRCIEITLIGELDCEDTWQLVEDVFTDGLAGFFDYINNNGFQDHCYEVFNKKFDEVAEWI